MSENNPSVLFVCVHNAGRSQMAAAYTRHLSDGAIEVRSAGSAPAETINPAVSEAMLEEGIDLSAQRPKVLTTEARISAGRGTMMRIETLWLNPSCADALRLPRAQAQLNLETLTA